MHSSLLQYKDALYLDIIFDFSGILSYALSAIV